MNDPNHPIWNLLTLTVCCATTLGIFALMANDFSLDDILRFVAIVPVIATGVYNRNILSTLIKPKE